MIALESVSKRYGARTVVEDVSFAVERGEILGFLGPNGAGKTTTIRMIAGVTTATSGRVLVAGYDMATQNEEAARKIGYAPEHPPLYDTLDVRSYLRFVAKVKGVPRRALAAETERAAEACRLQEVFRKEVFKLSKGYRQRLGLAQALVGSPEVLLLDEPTAGLDPGQILETRELIRSFGENHAVLLSTHILPEVSQITDRVVIINRGRVMAVDSAGNLSQRLRGREEIAIEVGGATLEEVTALVSAVPGVAAVRSETTDDGRVVAHVESDLGVDVRADVARAVAGRYRLLALRSETLSLEEIFLKLTGDGH